MEQQRDPMVEFARDLAEVGGWCTAILNKVLADIEHRRTFEWEEDDLLALDRAARALSVHIEDAMRSRVTIDFPAMSEQGIW